MNRKYNDVTGSSILEIMLVIFISSLGINYIFKTSLNSIVSIHKSSQYLQASYATQDIANRMQANYDVAKNTNAYIVSKFTVDPTDCKKNSSINNCQKKLCSAVDTANYDISIWKQMLACNLNNATAEIHASETGTIKLYKIIIEFDSVINKSNSDTNKSNKDEKKFEISTYQAL